MLEAAGRVVMVSGAARGIGRAVVERLLAAGFRVSAGVRDPGGLVKARRCRCMHYEAESLECAEGGSRPASSGSARCMGWSTRPGSIREFAVDRRR